MRKGIGLLSILVFLCILLSSYAQGQLARIDISPKNPTMSPNGSLTFTIVGYDAQGNPYPLTGLSCNWSCSSNGTIEVDQNDPTHCTLTLNPDATESAWIQVNVTENEHTFHTSTDISIQSSGPLARIEVSPGSVNVEIQSLS